MNASNKDLNLLLVFQMLYEERNATVVAERLALSQPALSHRLTRLRQEFGDPLFVRAPRGLTPTPRAHQLAPGIRTLVGEIEAFYASCDGDHFLQRAERLHLYATDYVEQTLLPTLLPRLREQAPQVVLVSRPTGGQLPREALDKGSCDVAITGLQEDLPDTLRQQRLRSERFVVLASRGNPHIGTTLTLKGFLACEHILTTLTGDLQGRIDQALAERGLRRKVVAGVSSFLSPTRLLRGSPWLLTCLHSLAAEAVAQDADLVLHELPLKVPKVQIMQVWHERTDTDPLRRWLRAEIATAARALDKAEAP